MSARNRPRTKPPATPCQSSSGPSRPSSGPGPGGRLGQITLSDNPIGGLEALRKELESLVNDPNLQFEQALIKVDPQLKYSELIKVIDVYSSLKPKPLTKLSFGELMPGEGEGSPP